MYWFVCIGNLPTRRPRHPQQHGGRTALTLPGPPQCASRPASGFMHVAGPGSRFCTCTKPKCQQLTQLTPPGDTAYVKDPSAPTSSCAAMCTNCGTYPAWRHGLRERPERPDELLCRHVHELRHLRGCSKSMCCCICAPALQYLSETGAGMLWWYTTHTYHVVLIQLTYRDGAVMVQ